MQLQFLLKYNRELCNSKFGGQVQAVTPQQPFQPQSKLEYQEIGLIRLISYLEHHLSFGLCQSPGSKVTSREKFGGRGVRQFRWSTLSLRCTLWYSNNTPLQCAKSRDLERD